jgi:hypothetical protein
MTHATPVLDRIVRDLLNEFGANPGLPIYEPTPDRARSTLLPYCLPLLGMESTS